MSSATDLIGHTLGGYNLVEIIGSGAMATVFKAFQPNLERWVAVKVLHYKESSALVRFQREAKAIALLRHRNILIVYEYGEEGNWPYIVMEYVEGGALNDHLTGRPMPWPKAVNLMIPVAEALWHAHRQGIIHRDVKPSNILLPQPDWPLLADFGLVKLSGAEHEVTRTGTSMGTPAYVAPEQARGAPVDHRADIYSLGVILFELITGCLPFDYPNPNKVLLAHISEPIPYPRTYNSGCPPVLEDIILTTMQKAPEERYKDMGQVITVLRDVMSSSVVRPAFYNESAPPARPAKERQETAAFRPEPPGQASSPVRPESSPTADTRPRGEPGPDAKIFITDKNATVQIPEQDSIVIGRTHRNIIADLDLGPYGAAQVGISRRHALLTRNGDQWLIDDLGSLNGTFVNEVPVKSGHPVPLKNGDLIRCSHMSFIFLLTPKN